VGEVEHPQRLQSISVFNNDFKDSFANDVVGHVDVAYTLQKLSHFLESGSSESVIAKFQPSNLMNFSGSMHILYN
jgi:hypothetical protein